MPQRPETPSFFKKTIFVYLFFLSLCLINFGAGFGNEFMIDDYDLVVDQVFVDSPTVENFYQLFIPDFKSHYRIEDSQPATYYRPMAHVIPFLQSLVFHDNPFGYRLMNAVLFALACLCFYVLLYRLTANQHLAFLSATLFCLHPINGLMVNYITASVFAVQLIFLSLSVIFAIRSTQGISNKSYHFLAMLMFGLALLCHETSLMLPGYLILVFWFLRQSLKQAIKNALPYIGLGGGYLLTRFYFSSLKTSLLSKVNVYSDFGWDNYIASFAKILIWYFSKILTARDIVLLWATPVVRDYTGLWVGGIFIVGIAIILLLFQRKRNDQVLFVSWFLLGLPPVAFGCMFIPWSGIVIEPHWLFFASFGLFGLVAGGLLTFFLRFNLSFRILGFLATGSFLLFSSWNNNALWKDELTYSQFWAKEVPVLKSPGFWVGTALFKKHQFIQAKQWFKESLSHQFSDWENYNNLAQIALIEHDEAQALAYYQNALSLFPKSAVIHNNLGVYYLNKKDLEKAEKHFREAHQFNPHQLESYLNLGSVLEQKNDWDGAWENYRLAYELRPRDERCALALMRIALMEKDRDNILARTDHFLRTIHSEQFLIDVAGLAAIKGHSSLALKFFLKAIERHPHRPVAYQEAGKVLANRGQYQQARAIWIQGLRQNPENAQLSDLLQELDAIMADRKD